MAGGGHCVAIPLIGATLVPPRHPLDSLFSGGVGAHLATAAANPGLVTPLIGALAHVSLRSFHRHISIAANSRTLGPREPWQADAMLAISGIERTWPAGSRQWEAGVVRPLLRGISGEAPKDCTRSSVALTSLNLPMKRRCVEKRFGTRNVIF